MFEHKVTSRIAGLSDRQLFTLLVKWVVSLLLGCVILAVASNIIADTTQVPHRVHIILLAVAVVVLITCCITIVASLLSVTRYLTHTNTHITMPGAKWWDLSWLSFGTAKYWKTMSNMKDQDILDPQFGDIVMSRALPSRHPRSISSNALVDALKALGFVDPLHRNSVVYLRVSCGGVLVCCSSQMRELSPGLEHVTGFYYLITRDTLLKTSGGQACLQANVVAEAATFIGPGSLGRVVLLPIVATQWFTVFVNLGATQIVSAPSLSVSEVNAMVSGTDAQLLRDTKQLPTMWGQSTEYPSKESAFGFTLCGALKQRAYEILAASADGIPLLTCDDNSYADAILDTQQIRFIHATMELPSGVYKFI